jgi:N6-L-threonylcarbamoyladenine synthase
MDPGSSGGRISRKILDLVSSYQQAIVSTLLVQTRKAALMTRPRSILLVGGVACNQLLRKTFKETFQETAGRAKRAAPLPPIPVYFPSPLLTTDNGAMVAAAGTPRLRRAPSLDPELNAYASLPLC